MAKAAKSAKVADLAPREPCNSAALVIHLQELADQRATDIRCRIDTVDSKIERLYDEKVTLTRQLAGVWSDA
jgi:hypothetical protein